MEKIKNGHLLVSISLSALTVENFLSHGEARPRGTLGLWCHPQVLHCLAAGESMGVCEQPSVEPGCPSLGLARPWARGGMWTLSRAITVSPASSHPWCLGLLTGLKRP